MNADYAHLSRCDLSTASGSLKVIIFTFPSSGRFLSSTLQSRPPCVLRTFGLLVSLFLSGWIASPCFVVLRVKSVIIFFELKQRSGHQYDVVRKAQIGGAMRSAFSEIDTRPLGLLRFDVFSIGC